MYMETWMSSLRWNKTLPVIYNNDTEAKFL